MNDILHRNPGEVARAIRNHRYDVTDAGIYLPGARAFIGGALKTIDYNRGDVQLVDIGANTMLLEGLSHMLNVAMPPTGGYSMVTQWYIAPFSGNYNPTSALTAATFPSTATEFTAYTAATRLPLVISAAASSTSTGNSGSPAEMTFAAGGPYNIYGAMLTSSATKGSTTGKGLACVRLTNPKLGMEAGERLGFEYVISATDAS